MERIGILPLETRLTWMGSYRLRCEKNWKGRVNSGGFPPQEQRGARNFSAGVVGFRWRYGVLNSYAGGRPGGRPYAHLRPSFQVPSSPSLSVQDRSGNSSSGKNCKKLPVPLHL